MSQSVRHITDDIKKALREALVVEREKIVELDLG